MVEPTQSGVLVLSIDVRDEEPKTAFAALEVLERLSGLELPATWMVTDPELASRIASRLTPNEVALNLRGPVSTSRGEFSRQLAVSLAALRKVGQPVTTLAIEGPLAHADLIAERGIRAIRTLPAAPRSFFTLVQRPASLAAPECVKGGLWNVPVTSVLGGKSGRRWLSGRVTRSVPSAIGQVAAEGGYAHLLITLEASGASGVARSVSPVLSLIQALSERGLKIETVASAAMRLGATRVRFGARGSILRAA